MYRVCLIFAKNVSMKKYVLFFLSFLFCGTGFAQNIPVTNLYLFQLATTDDDLVLTNPVFASKFNPDGYNNQPFFFSENEVYVTVQTENGQQTEIYALRPDRSELTRITDTPESEYSPTVMPDARYFSVVRTDADNPRLQRLWKYPIDRSNGGENLLPALTDIGYHAWINENEVLLFRVGDPNTLEIADLRTGLTKYVAENPGRCFKRMENGNIAVVHKSSPDAWFIKEVDVNTGIMRTIIQTLSGSEDFAVLSDGSFLAARGSKIYRYKENAMSNWKLVTDLNGLGVQNVTRMDVSRGGKLMLVGK